MSQTSTLDHSNHDHGHDHSNHDHCHDQGGSCCSQAASEKTAAAQTSCSDHACGCSGNPVFDGVDARYKRVLWMVIALNGGMFLIEMLAGRLAGSQALQADALDFLGDSVTYGMSLAVIGMSLRVRSTAAMIKGVSLLLMGAWIFGSTLYQVFFLEVPKAEVMGVIGLMALAANLGSVLLLMRYKDGDANVRSVWLCSRNDAIGNLAVLGASLSVYFTVSAWPDIAVALVMAGLFLRSAQLILSQSLKEYRESHQELRTA
ncbi:cation transporter [uncultured Cohaesibacter sp.]|uniref:cation transporter n=1 Tax=uncultured Cohaesibacter sp. TaxID=1002546 RepID=UPI0037495DA9